MIAAGGATQLHGDGINIIGNDFDEYYTKSRITPFKAVIESINELNLKTCLDLATSSGHFVYLANNNNIDCYGCDIEVLEKDKNFFKDKYNRDCLFEFDLNYLITLNKKYDIITNFHLTHVFSRDSFSYLLKVLSNKCQYACLHISQDNLKALLSNNLVSVIKTYKFEINMNNVANEYWVLMKFNYSDDVKEMRRYIRPDYLIELGDLLESN